MAETGSDNLEYDYDDHPSLSASLEDFAHNDNRSHFSGFKSEGSEGDVESNSDWSPGAPKKPSAGNGWYRHQPYLRDTPALVASKNMSRSRETSPQYESAMEDGEDITVPANIPLPRDSMSPARRSTSPLRDPIRHPKQDQENGKADKDEIQGKSRALELEAPETPNNYLRLAIQADMMQREPIEAAVSWLKDVVSGPSRFRQSFGWKRTLFMAFFAYFFISLFQAPRKMPMPDLVKVASFARSFEPLIDHSEQGVRQIADYQRTYLAVWDLAEHVRVANLTSADVIAHELDDLGTSLDELTSNLRKFYVNVDADMDSIILVTEWASGQLNALPSNPESRLAIAYTNMYDSLASIGLFENPSTSLPTALGTTVSELFGRTRSQQTYRALQHLLTEFLSILEESIESELVFASKLFSLHESIERSFLSIQRLTIRESDEQQGLQTDHLASMWARAFGPNAKKLRLYERNLNLLSTVRSSTLQNKGLLLLHNNRLVGLKQDLEQLKRRLASPLIAGGKESTVSVDKQVQSLETTYDYLRNMRNEQKRRVRDWQFEREQEREVERVQLVGTAKVGKLEIQGR